MNHNGDTHQAVTWFGIGEWVCATATRAVNLLKL